MVILKLLCSYALPHKRASAAVPRDPAPMLYSARMVLTRTAWVLPGPPEPQHPRQAHHSGSYRKLPPRVAAAEALWFSGRR
jgi:hypothetical protein